jgi:hypothetical protein
VTLFSVSMILWMLPAAFAGDTARVVVVGDGLVAGPPTDLATPPPMAGGWVGVLGDCLEERLGGGWTVVDRSRPGATSVSVLERVSEVVNLEPTVVLLGVGARELSGEMSPDVFQQQVSQLVELFRNAGPNVLLVGLVTPSIRQVEPAPHQVALDERTRSFDAMLSAIAGSKDGVRHLDLLRSWPHDETGRAALTSQGWLLSDKGHAKVGSLACEEVVEWKGR